MSATPFLDAAAAIGWRLCRDAVWSGDRCAWMGDAMELIDDDWVIVHKSFGGDLYHGSSGIGLFLATLYGFTGERLFAATARGAFKSSLSPGSLQRLPSRIGFYTGELGALHAGFVSATLLCDEQLRERSLARLRSITDVQVDAPVDVLSGYAGAIGPLLELHVATGEPEFAAAARLCGTRLLTAARVTERGLCWAAPHESKGLLGLSHGAAGIGWALAELYEATGDASLLRGAEGAFQYERSLFSSSLNNWPDLRSIVQPVPEGSASASYALAWCHGAPGIGLSRLRTFRLLGEPTLLAEVLAALASTRAGVAHGTTTIEGSFCLCHGHFGNADLLIEGAQALHDPQLRIEAEALGQVGMEVFEARRMPWPCGVLGGGETPGLLLGLAGIGYFYLRLHAPADVRSVLLVTPIQLGVSSN